MSTEEKACPFCSANSDQHTNVREVSVLVDDDPVATANRLFDALNPTFFRLAAAYDSNQEAALWKAVVGNVAALIVESAGHGFAASIMRRAAAMIREDAYSLPPTRPN